MSTSDPSATASRTSQKGWRELITSDDWWAVWIGLGLVFVAIAVHAGGGSFKWIAVAPQKWATLAEVLAQLRDNALRYVALLVLWAVLFGVVAKVLGWRIVDFVGSFAIVFAVALLIYSLGAWDQASHYNLEPPLVALVLGLLISNLVRCRIGSVPACASSFTSRPALSFWRWLAVRTDSVGRTGRDRTGSDRFARHVWRNLFSCAKVRLDRRFAAVLGAGGAVCGVSASIAIAGAVGAKKEDAPISITLVIFWAIVMIFVLPLISRALLLPTGVAGAWIGTSEFADAAGFAAAQTYGGYAGQIPAITGSADASVQAFTLMKVIGRDVWIGVWALVLSIIATTRWESTGVTSRVDASEIWRRFPKFILGFLIASVAVSLIAGDNYDQYKKLLVPDVVAPLQVLRTWVFTFCFLSIGLTTRLRDLAHAGARPFYAFTGGVIVNLILGYVLSVIVFAYFWSHLG